MQCVSMDGECARLEIVCTLIAYLGFKSLTLRQADVGLANIRFLHTLKPEVRHGNRG